MFFLKNKIKWKELPALPTMLRTPGSASLFPQSYIEITPGNHFMVHDMPHSNGEHLRIGWEQGNIIFHRKRH